MKESVLQSCQEFYAICVHRGRIPVNNWDGTWYYSGSPEAFDNYLAKFNADDRKRIVDGIPLPKDKTSTRIKNIADNIPQHQIKRLLKKLQTEAPDEYDKLMRDLGCSSNRTTQSS